MAHAAHVAPGARTARGSARTLQLSEIDGQKEMTQWKCHHGFTLSQQCRECELETARAFVEHYGPYVDEAREKIEELTREQPCTS